jgi:4-hydroxybenzoate polyprenyltransferase
MNRLVTFSNITNGTAATALFVSSFFLARVPVDSFAVIASWIAAVAAYCFFRPPVTIMRPFALAAMLCALGYLHSWISGHLPNELIWNRKGILYPLLWFGFIAFLAYLPSLIGVKSAFRLRNTWTKNAVIALTWTVFSLLPWMLVFPENDHGLLTRLASRFLLLFALSVASDISDTHEDKHTLKTIPQMLGRGKTEALILLMLLTSLSVQGFDQARELLAIVPAIFAILLMRAISPKWQREWILDSAMVAHTVVLIAFS